MVTLSPARGARLGIMFASSATINLESSRFCTVILVRGSDALFKLMSYASSNNHYGSFGAIPFATKRSDICVGRFQPDQSPCVCRARLCNLR